MTTRAVLPICALVRVVCGVAAEAGDGRLCDLGRLLVATGARGKAMGTFQRERGHRVVIEANLPPARRDMAGSAIGAVLPLMGIVPGMARRADAGRVLLHVARAMAAGAIRGGVPTQ